MATLAPFARYSASEHEAAHILVSLPSLAYGPDRHLSPADSIDYEEILAPLTEPPGDLNTGTSMRKDVNHFGWVSLFDRIIEIERNYFLMFDPELKTVDKVQKTFYSFLLSMISFGFDVNKDLVEQNNKPLHQAAAAGCKILATCLIQLGAQIDGYNCYQETPLYKAAKNNQMAVAQLLLENKADPEKINTLSDHETALHTTSSPEIIHLLFSYGATPNKTSKTHWKFTALHWNAHCARPDSVQALLDRGMKDLRRNSQGETALDIARKVQNGTYAVTLLAKTVGKENIQKRIDRTVMILERHHQNLFQCMYNTMNQARQV